MTPKRAKMLGSRWQQALISSWLVSFCRSYSLELNAEPPNAVAGEPFGVQPVVRILDNQGQPDPFFEGYAYADLYVSPSGTEVVRDANGSTASLSRIRIQAGYATFEGLKINEVGSGYRLRIVGEDMDNYEFAFAISSAFNVVIGPPYTLGIVGAPSSGTGGTPFSLQPLLRVVDLGGNLIPNWSRGSVRVSVNKGELLPNSALEVPVRNGYIQFSGLYINEASSGYILSFEADLDVALGGPAIISTPALTIAIGPPASIGFLVELPRLAEAELKSRAGHSFRRQPILQVYDAAGNIVVDESSQLLVVASVLVNPTGAKFIDSDAAYAFIDSDRVKFSNLGLNLVGRRYIIRFAYYFYDNAAENFVESGIYVDSHRFDVHEGPPSELRVLQKPGHATAGGTAFPEQPIVGLYDRGGNLLSGEHDAMISASIVTSLSASSLATSDKVICVDTSAYPPPSIIRLHATAYDFKTAIRDGEAAVGDELLVSIVFESEVQLRKDDGSTPTFQIDVGNASAPGIAYYIYPPGTYTSTPSFMYVVKPGDQVSSLDAYSLDALRVDSVLDPFERAVDFKIPIGAEAPGALANTTKLRIDTRPPIIRDVTISSPAVPGLYAAGTELIFNVTFSDDVVVIIGINGGPRLPIANLNRSKLSTLPDAEVAQALYLGGSDTATLQFRYRTSADEATVDSLPVNIAVNTSLVVPTGTTLRRRSKSPTTDIDPNVNISSVASAQIYLETVRPKINATRGISSMSPNGTYYAGDSVDLAIYFDHPVMIVTNLPPVLLLDTGVGVPLAARYLEGTGTKQLTFRYTVVEDDFAKRIDVYDDLSLRTGGGYIRRLATIPLIDADLDLRPSRLAGNGLSNQSAIEVDGVAPVVVSYGSVANLSASSTNVSSVYSFDDVIEIRIVFDKPVVAIGSPGLWLDCGFITRVATYASGNGSSALDFKYIVQVGDKTDQLGIVATATSVLQGFTTSAFDMTASKILLASTNPAVEADLTIRFSALATRQLGAPVFAEAFSNINTSLHGDETVIRVDASMPRPTIIKSVQYDVKPPSSIGAGERIFFRVEFTDEVLLTNFPPELQLNLGRRAIWLDGAGTKVWRFRYNVEIQDPTTSRVDVAPVSRFISLLPAGYPGNSPLWCNFSSGCNLRDRANNPVNFSITNISAVSSGLRDHPVEVDTTAPQVKDVWSRTPVSPYKPGPIGPYVAGGTWYTVGERLEFIVEFDKPVAILSDEGPLLHLDLGALSPSPYAEFEALETDTLMRFSIMIRLGDGTDNLTLVDILDNHNQAQVYRKSALPTTPVNFTLPASLRGRTLGANRTASPLIVATNRVPHVSDIRLVDTVRSWNVNVSVSNNIVVLAPGDDINLEVVFDASVSVSGVPVLLLNAGTHARAKYVSGSGTPILHFLYTIAVGDSTLWLDYTDQNALRRGIIEATGSAINQLSARASIKAASSSPSLAANLDLYPPGTATSLSSPTKTRIVIDSSIPAIVNIQPHATSSPKEGSRNKAYYSAPYEIIYLQVRYSAAVTVSGTPLIRLETGAVDRVAKYINGSNTTTLLFAYEIKPGDKTGRLEYFSDADAFRTSIASFVFPTGDTWIRRAAQVPFLDADSRLNPVYARLVSNGAVKGDFGASRQVEEGIAYFLDLAIVLHAADYIMRFACDHPDLDGIITLRTALTFDVEYAVDTVLRLGDGSQYNSRVAPYSEANLGYYYSHAGEPLDLFGWAVDVLADAGTHGLLVAGAPGKARPLPEVQLVTLIGAVDELMGEEGELEIQSYGVGVLPQPAIQSFIVYADPLTVLDGTFEMIYSDPGGIKLAAGAHVPVNADAISASKLLMDAYPDLGLVTASRAEYEWCACTHGANWSITFDGLVGKPIIGELRVDIFNVIAAGAAVTRVSRDRESSYVNGTWRLDLPATKYVEAKRTRAISSDATGRDIIEAIEIDLAPLLVKNVDIEETDSLGGRRWAVTFSTQQLPYFTNDIPLLKAVPLPALLESGLGANAWSYTVRNGSSPVTGTFTLKWRDPNTTTPPIPYNASAAQVRNALLTLPSINAVKVSRHEALLGKGMTWRVTFLGVKALDPRTTNLWVGSPLGDLEKVQVGSIKELIGTTPNITISKHNDVPSWAGAQRGSRGIGAGSAYIFSRDTISAADSTVTWAEEFVLETQRAEDYRGEGMGLGHSVSFAQQMSSDRIFVLAGAPWAEYHGVYEQQIVTCNATNGTFRLGMRGFWSDPVPWNATTAEFAAILVGKYGELDPLHPLPHLDVTAVGGMVRVCETSSSILLNSSSAIGVGALVTFASPPSGPGVDGTKVADIEPFEIDDRALLGSVKVTEIVKGTRKPHGIGALGDARGAAFLYRRLADAANPGSYLWRKVAKLVEHEKCRHGDRFGWVVALIGSGGYDSDDVEQGLVAAIGAPSAGPHREGYVFIFTSLSPGDVSNNAWVRAGEPLTSDVAGAAERDEFGYALAIGRSDRVYTLVVGAPGDDDNSGAVYIYKAESIAEALVGEFLFTQRLDGTEDRAASIFPRSAGDRYGCSVAIDGDDLVIGACGAYDNQLRGTHFSDSAEEVGTVVVFHRDGPYNNYVFVQRLRPTNALAGDRFGTAVAMSNGTIVATGLRGLRNLGDAKLVTDAPLTPRMAVWSLESSADSIGTVIGGTFRVGWRSLNASAAAEACGELPLSQLNPETCENIAAAINNPDYPFEGRTRWTRALKAASTAIEVRDAMQDELGTGNLYVSRLGPFDTRGGGYQWNITFGGVQMEFFEGIPPLVVDKSGLVGPGRPRIEIKEVNKRPPYARGNGHIFVRVADSSDEEDDSNTQGWTFIEQALLRQFNFQRQDLFGFSAAIDGDIAAIGAPNSDSEEPGVNSGAVSSYELSFLRLEFRDREVNVTEGESVGLVLRRRQSSEGGVNQLGDIRLYAFVYTLSRNADSVTQFWWKTLYDLTHGRAVPPGQTAADVLGAGLAYGRAQYYGGTSNASAWVDGGRDDLGVSDFVPIAAKTVLPPDVSEVTVPFQSIDDAILEVPDEATDIILWMPGMVASPLGSLHVRVTIVDNGDGLDGAQFAAFAKLGESRTPQLTKTLSMAEVQKGISLESEESRTYYDGRRAATASAAFLDSPVELHASEGDDTVVALGSVNAEEVLVYRRSAWTGLWNLEAELRIARDNGTTDDPPPLAGQPRLFGTSVAGGTVFGRRAEDGGATIVVGAPGAATVYVFSRILVNVTTPNYSKGTWRIIDANVSWTLTARLTYPLEAKEARHDFGRAVALEGDVVAVGAPGLEAVYLYYRKWDGSHFAWELGQPSSVVRSSDYDYDVLVGGTVAAVHEQGFGWAVSLSNNRLAVGAPFADYGNIGSIMDRELRNTDGVDNRRLGRGKVYVFHSSAPSVTVTVRSDGMLSNGTWTLTVRPSYRNITGGCVTSKLAFDAPSAAVESALLSACSGSGFSGRISVSRDTTWSPTHTSGRRLSWTITFVDEVGSPPPLEALWQGYGCPSCYAFDFDWELAPSRQVAIDDLKSRGTWHEEASLQSDDRMPGSAFGSVLALDNDALLVGAPRAMGSSTTTWGFETGDLSGWARTGTAFDDQPTFGDGPAFRQSVEADAIGASSSMRTEGDKSRSARPRGRYFVGTAEARPGSPDDYQQPSPALAGTFDGSDVATGTLTSEAVPLPYGETLLVSFLVGGGCDPLAVYIEVLVDGVSVDRETGRCDDRMYNATFDLSAFAGRAAVFRIVDSSRSNWGRINIDHFSLSWSTGRATVTTSSKGRERSATGIAHRAGAAYIFRLRHDAWSFEVKLNPSDKRAGDGFGASLAIDATNGVAAVGAPLADGRTHWRLPPPSRPVGAGPPRGANLNAEDPYSEPDEPTRAVPVRLPLSADLNFRLCRPSTTSVFEPSGARAVWAQLARDRAKGIAPAPDLEQSRDAGVVYVFEEIEPNRWTGLEVAELHAPSNYARDHFGGSVALLPKLLLVGAPGDDSFGNDAGSAFAFDPHVLYVRFSESEFAIVEGHESRARILLERDVDRAENAVTVAYSTEDLSAKGIDADKMAACTALPIGSRDGCGDYQQTMGTVSFPAGKTQASFYVTVVDDRCYEHYSEYLQLTISIPGAPALLGEHFIARLRIDDDDYDEPECTHSFL